MSGMRPSKSNDAARARIQDDVRRLSDDERLVEALRMHDVCLAFQALFADVLPRPARPASAPGPAEGSRQ